jgi:uncharacterized protein YcfL
MKKLIIQSVLLLSVAGLVACGGDSKKHSNSSSSSVVSSSSSSVKSNAMELNKEYAYTDSTKITNTGKTELVVIKKYYWESQKTVVILKEGSATID